MPAHPKASTVIQPSPQGEEIAIAALGFIAGDEERLSRFLALTGIDPASMRQQIGDPHDRIHRGADFMDHVFEDESLLLAFCADINMDPARLVQIHQRMTPHNHHGLREG